VIQRLPRRKSLEERYFWKDWQIDKTFNRSDLIKAFYWQNKYKRTTRGQRAEKGLMNRKHR